VSNATVMAVGSVTVSCSATASTYLMAGCGQSLSTKSVLTPTGTGRVQVTFNGQANVVNADARLNIIPMYGTGTAPSTNGASAGTVMWSSSSQQIGGTSDASTLLLPFSVSAVITGLSTGTQYWFDIEAKSSAGTTGDQVSVYGVTIVEC
jgi:hypothetical protein